MAKTMKAPCRECPWRRDSMNGWLGADNADGFYETMVTREVHGPCHTTVDYEDEDWQQSADYDAPRCAGQAVFFKNICKLPRNPETAAAVNQVQADRSLIFATPAEFYEHHRLPRVIPANA